MVSCWVNIEEISLQWARLEYREARLGVAFDGQYVTFWENTDSTPNPGSDKLIIHTCFTIQQYTFLPF